MPQPTPESPDRAEATSGRELGQVIPAAPHAARLTSLDSLRGLIMIIMAVDHASAFIARAHGSEFWTGPFTRYATTDFTTGPLAFLTRFVTHLCAPGFFFLMGAGMTLFHTARKRAGWSDGRITRYFLLRGFVLVGVNLVLENRAWSIGFSIENSSKVPMDWLLFTVISGLGMSMMVGGLLLPLGRALGAVAIALLLGCAAVVPLLPYDFFHAPHWLRFLLLPGKSPAMFLLYPLLPWLGVCTLGMAMGRWLAVEQSRDRALRLAPLVGLLLIAIALALRIGGGFGNLRPPRDGSWIEFLNFIKYPPALVFALFMVGVNLVLLGLLSRLRRVPILTVFGQAPLCFYLAHLFLYALIGLIFFRKATSLPGMYPVWLAGLVPLYFLCRWYRAFKETKPAESLWRLF